MAIEFAGLENRAAIPSIIAKEALYRLKHHLVIPRISNKTYNEYFERKVGSRITVKRPFKAKAQTGRVLKKSEMIDKTVDINLNQRFHFALQAVDEDMTIHIEDYGSRYLDAGAEELAYQYDIAGANELAGGFFLSDGTPGTELNLDDTQIVRAHATKMAIPNQRSYALLDPLDIAAISSDIVAVDMPEMVGENIKRAFRGQLAGWSVLESVHVPYLEVNGVPTSATPLIDGANQRGDEIDTDGWTNAGDVVLKAGALIQIAGVGEVQPRGDRRTTGNLQTFVVLEDVTPTAGGRRHDQDLPGDQ